MTCRLFESIAEETWERVLQNRLASLNPQEPGITTDIITRIRNTCFQNRNIGIWSNPGYNEPTFGSDIDIFVEYIPNKFIWYPMQAKSLKPNRRYTNLRERSLNEYQWVKLQRLRDIANCIPYYLLYNGIERTDFHQYTDVCRRNFFIEQFGCSVVSLDNIIAFALRTDEDGQFSNPLYEEIHPEFAHPWRVLTCCRPLYRPRLFTIEQINEYTKPYTLLSELEPFDFDYKQELQSAATGETERSDPNFIVNCINLAKYSSKYILLFKDNSVFGQTK